MTPTNRKEVKIMPLARQFGVFDSTMIMVGIVIGSGIFLTTGIIAKVLPSVPLILLAWVVGGFLTLTGSLTYAELGAAMPQAGGLYVYLRKAYGPLTGFVFGWISFLICSTGAVAGMSLAFAEYFGYFFPSFSIQTKLFTISIPFFHHPMTYSLSAGQCVALSTIAILTLVNYIGVIFGKMIQNILTLLKIGALLALVGLGIFMGKGTVGNFSLNPSGLSLGQIIVGFGLAQIAIAWTFGGWSQLNSIAGEIRNPQKNLPLALVFGTFLITGLYVLTNYIYLYALPLNELSGVVRVAEKAASSMFGGTAASLISAAAMISVLGAVNGLILAGPRVYYAMALDGLFFRKAAAVHPRYRTPGFSMIAAAAWASVLVLSASFEQLLTLTIFVTIIFWMMGVGAVFILRKKAPELPRPYKTWGYPVIPCIYLIAAAGILINTVLEKPVESFAGLGITAIGIPVYYYWRKKGRPLEDPKEP